MRWKAAQTASRTLTLKGQDILSHGFTMRQFNGVHPITCECEGRLSAGPLTVHLHSLCHVSQLLFAADKLITCLNRWHRTTYVSTPVSISLRIVAVGNLKLSVYVRPLSRHLDIAPGPVSSQLGIHLNRRQTEHDFSWTDRLATAGLPQNTLSTLATAACCRCRSGCSLETDLQQSKSLQEHFEENAVRKSEMIPLSSTVVFTPPLVNETAGKFRLVQTDR